MYIAQIWLKFLKDSSMYDEYYAVYCKINDLYFGLITKTDFEDAFLCGKHGAKRCIMLCIIILTILLHAKLFNLLYAFILIFFNNIGSVFC